MHAMYKQLTLAIAAFLCGAALYAQAPTGGVKGTVVDRNGRAPIENARLKLYAGTSEVAETVSGADGGFLIGHIADGMYTLVVVAPDFLETVVNVTVNDGYVKNMFNVSLSAQSVAEVDDSNFAEFDLEDSGFNDNPTILFGANDVFNNIAGYNFSAVRFRTRGYASESQDVYVAGVKMNDAITGYSPYSLWSGLNEATRTKETVIGNEVSDSGLGGVNGLTNIAADPGSFRSGLRLSVITNSALYRLGVRASYASGELDNGWSYAFNVATRLGGNDWIKGVYYRSFAYYAGIGKNFDDVHRLNFAFFAAPGERGAQNASTQEVYDLVGDNMYSSNWGYQGGKVRNARVRKTHEPVTFLKYGFKPSDRFSASATVLYRFGKNGYTALDYYDAASPNPDYYRNLPSYFYNDNTDYNRLDRFKYAWAEEVWTHSADYPGLTHMNWDRFYTVNRQNLVDGVARSKYVQEERHVDQRDLNLAASFKWRPADWAVVTGGLDGRVNRTEYYKVVADLLGGDYYVNIDSFAERDFSSSAAKVQNDLDYYLQHQEAQKLRVGDKYNYDYYAHVRRAGLWANGRFNFGDLSANVGARVGYASFWREGLVRKGLFAGLDDNGQEIVVDGETLTAYDPATGEVISSKGDSKVSRFLTYAGKAGLNYVIGGNMRVYANVGYFNDAPTFNQAFISPRTRNTLIPDLTTTKTFSADVNWQYTGGGYNARVTGYYTRIMDQTKVMSAYDDLQNAFSNFAMSGIDERHYGIELGVKVPTPLPNLSVQGVLSWGRYEYVSNPRMTQTVDNSAEVIIADEVLPYWQSSPVYKRDASGLITGEVDRYRRHYVPSTPQLAASLGLSYNYNYWFIDLDAEYFDYAYLDMNPLYRSDYATMGPDGTATPTEIEYMTAQEKFDAAFLVNLSVGKSWYIQRKYQLGFSLNAKNLLDNRSVKTGGYEQTRLVDNTSSEERYYKFDPKYFYMSGVNYMLNLYFRF